MVFTAVVTSTLLTGQSEDEETKERNSKVFEKKLSIYQEFLEKLCDVIKDDVITKQEAVELEFATSYIAMHMKSEDVESVISSIRDIIGGIGVGSGKDNAKSSTPKALFDIVTVFKKDLYRTAYDTKDAHILAAIEAFEGIVSDIEGQVNSEGSNSRNVAITVSEKARMSIQQVIDGIIKEMGDGWNGAINSEAPLGFIIDKGDPEDMSFYIHCDPEYYFQLHVGAPERDLVVYNAFKEEYGGRRNKWSWWQYIAPDYRDKNLFLKFLDAGDRTLIDYLVAQTVERLRFYESI